MNSNQAKPRPHFLRLVDDESVPDPITHETFTRAGWQKTLFAHENPSLVVFISFQDIGESDFTTILTSAHPKYLFDLRRVPRFDLGSLNRRQVFSLFAAAGIQYLDLSVPLNENTSSDRSPNLVVELLAERSGQMLLRGPIALIVDPQQFDEEYITKLIEALPGTSATTWDVLRVPFANPLATEQQKKRNVVFISHANPEDNAFTTWLSGQLALSGYSVWSDVARLVGGETFWDDIEETIRYRTAKVIAVLSKASLQKPGVLDEIDLAVRVERSAGLNRFVLPIRLDDLPYSEVRANIARKNIIDFGENWATGLHAVLHVLERDRTPRLDTGNAEALSHWVTDRFARSHYVVSTPESLTANWLPITQLPEHIFLYDVSAPIERIDELVRSLSHPAFRYLRLIGSFSSAADLQPDLPPQFNLSESYRIKTENFLRGTAKELSGLPRWEANKIAISLLRQAWNLNMKRMGLRSFETASGQLAWYMPTGFLESNRVEFLDSAGKKRRKSLVGWSDRRKVFWHFAVEARPVLSGIPRFIHKQHVIFTPKRRP